MSGHSKWATIKRKKGTADAKRGQLFTRLAREIVLAAREGGGDPESNFKLRLAIEKARANNMPKENVERAVKRGTGEDKEGGVIEQVTYEGYAPHGIALLIDVVTDNRNRAVSEIRRILTRAGGSLGEGGSVAWQFARKTYFSVPAAGHNPDSVFELAVDAGADDVQIGKEDDRNLRAGGGLQSRQRAVAQGRDHARGIRAADGTQPANRAHPRSNRAGDEGDRVARGVGRREHGLYQSADYRRSGGGDGNRRVGAASMRVVGIDPGTATTGYGVIEESAGRLKLIDYGTVCTGPDLPMARRLLELHIRLTELIALHAPETAAVESLFFQKNVRTAITVGQARGVILLTLARGGVPVSEYTPMQIKQAVAGYGGAEKRQVQAMVRAHPGDCGNAQAGRRGRRAGGGHLPRAFL